MSVVGIPDDTREDILSLMAALLHLGNVNFVEDGNYAKVQNDDCEHALSPLFFNVFIKVLMTYLSGRLLTGSVVYQTPCSKSMTPILSVAMGNSRNFQKGVTLFIRCILKWRY